MREHGLTGRSVGAAALAAARAAGAVRFGMGGWARPARIALCVAVPLTAGLAADRTSWGMVASLGSFTGFYAHAEPYRRRALLLGGVALGLAASVVLGGLVAGSTVLAVAAAGAVATIAAFVCLALDVGPPREHMLILVCLLSESLPMQPASAWARGGLTLAGGGLAWAIVMSGWLRDRSAPERSAVAAGLERVAALLEDGRGRHAAVLAVRAGRHGVADASDRGAARLRAFQQATEQLLEATLSLHLRGEPGRSEWAGRAWRLAALLRTDATASAPCRDEPTGRGFREPVGRDRPAAAVAAPRIEAAFDAIANALSRPERRVVRLAADPRRVRAAFGAHSLVPPTALRIGVAIAVTVALGHGVRSERPYWIALSVSAVLQGQTLFVGTRRAVERAAGTAVGVVVAAAILALNPAAAAVVATIVLLQLATEAVIVSSYAVAVVFITPLTLLLSELAAPGTVTGHTLTGRLIDTVLGCIVGLAAARLLWPTAADARLSITLRRALDAVADALETASARDSDPGAVRRARHRLRVELVNLRAVSDTALGDRLTTAPRADPRWPIVASIERLRYLAISAPVAAETREGLRAALSGLASAAGGDAPPTTNVTVPALPGLPRTQAELEHLSMLIAQRTAT